MSQDVQIIQRTAEANRGPRKASKCRAGCTSEPLGESREGCEYKYEEGRGDAHTRVVPWVVSRHHAQANATKKTKKKKSCVTRIGPHASVGSFMPQHAYNPSSIARIASR